MLRVLELTLPVFSLVFCGFFGQRWKLLPAQAVQGINAFVFFFALPAMLFRAVATQSMSAFSDWRFVMGYAVAGLIVFFFTRTAALPRGLDPAAHPRDAWAARSEATAAGLNAAHGNVGYMGVPLGIELGKTVLPTLIVAMIIDIFLIITISIALLELDRRHARRTPEDRPVPVLWTVVSGLIRSPLVLSIAAGMLWSLLDRPMPEVMDNFTRILGGAAGPCALFAIGASLGDRRIDFSGGVTGLTTMKLLVHPTVAAILLYFVFQAPHQAAAVGVLVASLPSASNSFIIAQRYGVDARDISASILGGTFFALITVSLTIWALGLRAG